MKIIKSSITLLLVLFSVINAASASEYGIQPNKYGDTVINKDTFWDQSNISCGGNVTVGNLSQKTNFVIKDSYITIDGMWIMGGDTQVNFTLLNSTIYFNSIDGIPTSQPPGTTNTSQKILVQATSDKTKKSNITMINSKIRGKDYSHLAAGLDINSGVSSSAQHNIIIDNVSFEYMGSLDTSGRVQYALEIDELDPTSRVTNITLNYCGRGICSKGNIEISNVTSNGGYLAFISGKRWNNLLMNKTVEGLYNPKDNAWIGNSFFDSNQTKLNIMSASNVTFENNTVVLAAFNAGDGSWEYQGNNNTLLNNKFIRTGVGSRKTGTKILNNTFYEGMPTGGNIPINIAGFNFSVKNNEITKGSVGILIQPHPFYQSAGGHVVQDNIINSSGIGISIKDQYSNKFIKNQIEDTYSGAGIQIENSSSQVFIDNSISNTKTHDIYLKGKNDNISFINTEFNETKIGFNDSIDVFKNFYYVDVKVLDSNGDNVSGATVDIQNNVDEINYKPANIDLENKRPSVTKEDGHIPFPSDKNDSVILLDYWQNKMKVEGMIYSITATKDGLSATVADLNPDRSWYRPDPNIPTYTITAIIPDNSTGPHITGFAPSEDNPFNPGEKKSFRVWTDENLTEMNWTVDGKPLANGTLNCTWNVSEGSHIIGFNGTSINGNINKTWYIGEKFGDNISSEEPQNESIVRINPEYLVVSPGEPFALNIWIEPSTAITGAQFDLFFKDLMVKVNGVKEGNLFSQNGASTYFSNGTVCSSERLIRHIYGSILGESTVSSPGTLAVINLTAGNSTGIAEFNLSNVIISDVNSSRLPNCINNSSVLIDTAPELDMEGSKSVDKTENLTFTVSAKDADGDRLAFSASSLPIGANFDPATGVFTWTPLEGQGGVYTVTFKVSDGYLDDSENVGITVNTPNSVPSITSFEPANGSIFNEGENITISLKASDADGQALSYLIKINGTVYSTTPGYVWNTNYSSNGSHTLELTVSDGIEEVKKVNTIYINDVYPRWDVNKDGVVDIGDVTRVSRTYGTITKAPYPDWDVNQDGMVDKEDLDIINLHIGEKVE